MRAASATRHASSSDGRRIDSRQPRPRQDPLLALAGARRRASRPTSTPIEQRHRNNLDDAARKSRGGVGARPASTDRMRRDKALDKARELARRHGVARQRMRERRSAAGRRGSRASRANRGSKASKGQQGQQGQQGPARPAGQQGSKASKASKGSRASRAKGQQGQQGQQGRPAGPARQGGQQGQQGQGGQQAVRTRASGAGWLRTGSAIRSAAGSTTAAGRGSARQLSRWAVRPATSASSAARSGSSPREPSSCAA